ncbi:Uncharacterised protein [Amycolatopsis camponoti]|uniref:NACHT domain-containing protein n=1 Tax=Amycolatopsis camponoti TaxID=2606593 RepID=A0A6I8LMW4_9PSEU|nr:serine protease [Amycolatopsis camponoti]VVJ18361.1 Uncharacterised protein [Amycolatopsis camponoti]
MSGQRAALAAIARAATVPLTIPSGAVKGTGFRITPIHVLTCAHVVTQDAQPVDVVHGNSDTQYRVLHDWLFPGGPDGLDLALLETDVPADTPSAYLAEPVAPGDELWVFGYPDGNYRAGDSASMRLEGLSEHIDGPVLLKGNQGRIRSGMSGGPVLNWRTGAVCGIVRYRDGTHPDTARFVPTTTIFATYPGLAEANRAAARTWLELLADDQIEAAGVCFPGPLMRRYLKAASTADDTHPYAAMLDVRSPLARVYLRQRVATEEHPGLVEASDLLDAGVEAQVLGGPGAGKSSLARHLTALSARRWLDEATGIVVPILITAEALTHGRGLTEMLAEGVVQAFDNDLDRTTLTAMFSNRPFPGADWLVLVDGVDEVLYPSLRDAVLAKIARHRVEGRYRFLLTTRPLPAYLLDRVAERGRYPTFVIEPFGRDELETFAARWFTQLHLPNPAAAAADFGRRVDETGIGQLATIPLIATMLCIVYANAPEQRLPGNRAELYGQFVELLLTKRKITNVRARLATWTGRSGDQAVASGEELLTRTPELLKLLAHSQHHAASALFAGAEPEPVAVIANEVTRPAELSSADWASVIREVLRSCGLLVERRGGFTFIHQTIQEYLAAAHLAEHHPDPRRRPARRLMVPAQWPRPDLEVLTFLAALWAKDGRDLHPVLSQFLSRRHRHDNYRFVLELHLQGVSLPDQTRRKLIGILASWVRDPGRNHEDWRAASRALDQVAPQHAAAVFAEVASSAESWQRRFDSSVRLLAIQPTAGFQALEELAIDERVGGSEQLKAAKTLSEHHPARGIAALARIAAKVDPDNLRVEAAQLVADHDHTRGLELLRAIAWDRRAQDKTRLRAAIVIGQHDAGEALTRLSQQNGLSAWVRLDAATGARTWSIDGGADLVLALVRNTGLDIDVRLAAAEHLAREGAESGIEGFEAIARTESRDTTTRVRAAARAMEIDPAGGLALHLDLVADPSMHGDRVTVGLAAGQRDPSAAATALANLVGKTATFPNSVLSSYDREFWVRAGKAAATLDPAIGLPALDELVFDGRHDLSLQLQAAEAATEVDRDHGLELLRRLAEDSDMAETQVEAAVKLYDLDRWLGKTTVLSLVSRRHPRRLVEERRITLGKRIGRSNQKLGIAVLRQVATDPSVRPKLRLDATTAVTGLDWEQGSRLATQVGGDPAVGVYLKYLKATGDSQ